MAGGKVEREKDSQTLSWGREREREREAQQKKGPSSDEMGARHTLHDRMHRHMSDKVSIRESCVLCTHVTPRNSQTSRATSRGMGRGPHTHAHRKQGSSGVFSHTWRSRLASCVAATAAASIAACACWRSVGGSQVPGASTATASLPVMRHEGWGAGGWGGGGGFLRRVV